MPKPRVGEESQAQWMQRCVPQVIADHTANHSEQAVAICLHVWHDAGGKALALARKYSEDEPRDDHGRWTTGGGGWGPGNYGGPSGENLGVMDTLPHDENGKYEEQHDTGKLTGADWQNAGSPADRYKEDQHTTVRESGAWGDSHGNSQTMAAEAAYRMGLPGAEKQDLSRESSNSVGRMLDGIASDSVGSNEIMYHGFANANIGQRELTIGKEFSMPLTAISGDRDTSGYGIRLDPESQRGEPSMLEFAKGTPFVGYSKLSPGEAKLEGYKWSEGITAGTFKVVNTYVTNGGGWRNTPVKVYQIVPISRPKIVNKAAGEWWFPGGPLIDLRKQKKDYNPDEPRDEIGRWTTGGGAEAGTTGAGGSDAGSIAVSKIQARSDIPQQTKEQLAAVYQASAAAKASFDQKLTEISQTIGAQEPPMLAPLKGVDRAVEKTMFENGGNGNQLKDVLRGTILIDSSAQQQRVMGEIRSRFGEPINPRDLLSPGTQPGPDGYRDMKMNVDIGGGKLAEIQVNYPQMVTAKETQGHHYYEAMRAISNDIVARGHEAPGETARLLQLNNTMRQIYSSAWAAATAQSVSKALLEIGVPLRAKESNGKTRPSGTSHARHTSSGVHETGTPSTLAKLVSVGKVGIGAKYSPDEPRDEIGRWTSGGAGTVAATTLASMLATAGGFTYQPVTHDSPKNGYALSILPGNEKVIEGEVKAEDIQAYMDAHAGLFASNPDAHFGAWRDTNTGKIYLDVSVVKSDRQAAIDLGKAHGQLAIYNLGTGETIPLKDAEKAGIHALSAQLVGPTNRRRYQPGARAGPRWKETLTGTYMTSQYQARLARAFSSGSSAKGLMNVPLELKSMSERQFEGYGSTFGNVDFGGDIVIPGAFQKTLDAHKSQGSLPQMFWMHDPTRVPGKWLDMSEDDHGLYVKGQLAPTPLGDEIHALLKMDAVRGLSIGYMVSDDAYDKSGNRLLKEVELFEVSPVSMAMNPLASVTHVKCQLSNAGEYVPTPRELEEHFREMGCSRKVAVALVARIFGKESGSGMLVDSQRDADDSELASALDELRDTVIADSIRI